MTKTEIVEAAFKVWGRSFYLNTSLSQLAKELGVSKPALYRHFKCKKALTLAMNERFLDDLSESVRESFEQAGKTAGTDEGISLIIQSVAGYYARNVYYFIFTMINIHDRTMNGGSIQELIKNRGVKMDILNEIIKKKYNIEPPVIRLIFTTLTFYMSDFHGKHDSMKNPVSAEQIRNIISRIIEVIKNGLKFSSDEIKALDFEKLEQQVAAMIPNTKPEPLFKAVAEAVAEAGPWNTSMEMVAKRIGLSKSSLYGHFKDKKDMLRRLFLTEFMRIIEFARNGINSSENPAEQLYLGIYSISVYLNLRSEILAAMDWIRERKLDIGKPDKYLEFFKVFEDVDIESLRNGKDAEKQFVSHWILFLLIGILMQPFLLEKGKRPGRLAENIKSGDIRLLYKFITMGLGGFTK